MSKTMAQIYQQCRHIPQRINANTLEDDIKSTVQVIRPQWKDFAIKFLAKTPYSDCYLCSEAADTTFSHALLLKIYNNKRVRDATIGERLLHNWKLLNSKSVGIPLYATFQNGLVMKYTHGSLMTYEQTKDPKISKLVAEEFANLHENCIGEKIYEDENLPKNDINCLGTYAHNFIAAIKEILDTEGREANSSTLLTLKQVEEDMIEVHNDLSSRDLEVVLSHNDPWSENILVDERDCIVLIDYDALDKNYAPFDVAVYLITCAANPPQVDKRPSTEFCKSFIRHYLERRQQIRGKSTTGITEQEVEEFYKNVVPCIFLRLVYCVIYALHILKTGDDSSLDYNTRLADGFTSYYEEFRKEYKQTTPV